MTTYGRHSHSENDLASFQLSPTFFKSNTPPSAPFNRSTNLEVRRPSDFSWRPPVTGLALPPSTLSESDIVKKDRAVLGDSVNGADCRYPR